MKECCKEDIAYLRQKVSKIPSSLRILRKGSDGNGFVKISASWSLVSTYSKDTTFFSTWSLRKWCRISMCLVLECKTWFFVRLIALVLSHLIGTQPSFKSYSRSCCLVHKIWEQQLPAATYSASAVERATLCCFLLCHEIKQFPKKMTCTTCAFSIWLATSKIGIRKPN